MNKPNTTITLDGFNKGKKNKLKVGDIVEFTPHCVKWHATNLVENYSVPSGSSFGREIVRHFDVIVGWLDAYVSNKMPKGKVVGYGAGDDNKKDLNNVRIEIKFKYCKTSHYFSEVVDVKKFKSKKIKK